MLKQMPGEMVNLQKLEKSDDTKYFKDIDTTCAENRKEYDRACKMRTEVSPSAL